jgi:hypothetical protein
MWKNSKQLSYFTEKSLQLPMQSVSIITKVVSSNPNRGEVYSIQHYVICVSRWFSPGTPVSSTNKTDHHDIAKILLKVELNTIHPLNPRKLNSYF